MNTFFDLSRLLAQQHNSNQRYLEFLRVPALSAGVYVLPAGETDPQKQHKEDELYYVARGSARMRVGDDHRPVGAGSIIFVKAGVEHQFYDIEEDLAVVVFFAPAESS